MSATKDGRGLLVKLKGVRWCLTVRATAIVSKVSVIVRLVGREIFARLKCLARMTATTGVCASWVNVTADRVSEVHLVN